MRKDFGANAEAINTQIKVLARETLYPRLKRDVLAADVAVERRSCCTDKHVSKWSQKCKAGSKKKCKTNWATHLTACIRVSKKDNTETVKKQHHKR